MTWASEINDAGHIVGYCQNQEQSVWKPFLWQDGQMIDLDQSILDHPEITMMQASSINSSGQIAGTGWEIDRFLGLLLTPVGRSADLDGDGLVGVRDLQLVIDARGPCPGPLGGCPADLDADGTVGMTDLLALLSAWG